MHCKAMIKRTIPFPGNIINAYKCAEETFACKKMKLPPHWFRQCSINHIGKCVHDDMFKHVNECKRNYFFECPKDTPKDIITFSNQCLMFYLSIHSTHSTACENERCVNKNPQIY